jgi:hypothetical protein
VEISLSSSPSYGVSGEAANLTPREGVRVNVIRGWADRALSAFERQDNVRRAAIIGVGFGLLLCVVVFGICLAINLLASLGA